MKKYSVGIIVILVLLYILLFFTYSIYRIGYHDGAVKYYRVGFKECADSLSKEIDTIKSNIDNLEGTAKELDEKIKKYDKEEKTKWKYLGQDY